MKSSSRKAENANANIENDKSRKCDSLATDYFFMPATIETMGTWGDDGKTLIQKLEKC